MPLIAEIPAFLFNDKPSNIDLQPILPNVFVGSYPHDSLSASIGYLAKKFNKVIIVNLVAEKPAYQIPSVNKNSIQLLHVPWYDFCPLPLAVLDQTVRLAASFLLESSDHDTRGLFVHCQHGKGRTGTFICSLLIYLYGVDFETANKVFVQRRRLYDVGVKAQCQIQTLNYWKLLVDGYQKCYSNWRKLGRQFVLSEILLISSNLETTQNVKKKSKMFKVSNINISCTDTNSPKRSDLKYLTIGTEAACDFLLKEDMCLSIERKKCGIFQVYAALYFNCLIEAFINNIKLTDPDSFQTMLLYIPWEKMDGIKGTSFRGQKKFKGIQLQIRISSNPLLS